MSSQQYQMIIWYKVILKTLNYKKKYLKKKKITFKFDIFKDDEYNANSVYSLNRKALTSEYLFENVNI